MKNQRGITLVEIIITTAVAGFLFGIGVMGYSQWQTRVVIVNDRDELKSTLLRAQQMATAAASSTAWGLHLEEGYYVMFSGSFYDQNNPNNRTWSLRGSSIVNPTTTFSDGIGGFGSDTVFGKFTGETYNTGTVTLITSNSSTTKFVNVDDSGQIY